MTSCFSVLQTLKLDWLRRTGYVHKAAFIAELHDAEGGARDVAGRGSPAGNAIGPVRQTWAGGVFAGLLIRRCNFVSVLLKNKVIFAMTSTSVHLDWEHLAPPRVTQD